MGFRLILLMVCFAVCTGVSAQDFSKEAESFRKQRESMAKQYESFKAKTQTEFESHRQECNKRYAEFLRDAWQSYEGKTPIPRPKDDRPIPPLPFDGGVKHIPVVTVPIDVKPVVVDPQPKPVEPIREVPSPDDDYFSVDFYGVTCRVRLPESARIAINRCSNKVIAEAWESLNHEGMNNTIRDCLETRMRYNLCDWAYLEFLDELCKKFCPTTDGATLLMAYLYSQSGYQMRLGMDNGRLIMLYGSRHKIFDKVYYSLGGTDFYPYGTPSRTINICNMAFDGEKPMSLLITQKQKLGADLSSERRIESERYPDMSAISQVPKNLIAFFNGYPTSSIGGNVLTRWAMYANTPMAEVTMELLYPSLVKSIEGCSEETAANKLLNWVQTGLEYEYDDKVWGHDRAFFAEESLYYPYSDCEDRSILFSRLVRDLLGLDVALVYYPGHLATAVCFKNDVTGDAMMIGGRRFVVCDPTYIGAPVGAQMPNLQHEKAQAIVLER